MTFNDYVASEIKRVNNFFDYEAPCLQEISIKKHSFFVQVNASGRWIAWSQHGRRNMPEEFGSNNIDFSSDQEACLAALVAMNTWLREH